MSNYLIKLFPVGKFFFGGDMTFPVGMKESKKKWDSLKEEEKEQIKYNTRYSSYIIKSEMFPQQTSLLGMLRFFLLRNEDSVFDLKDNKIINSSEADKLIGKSSFVAGVDGKYGCIRELSPCFLMKGDQIITRMPMDHSIEEVSMDNQDNQKRFYNSREINLSTVIIKGGEKLIEFNAKDGDVSAKYGYFSVAENRNIILNENEIFIEDQRIGINRDIVTGHTEDNALFKQVNYRLADDFCFAFYAKVDKDITAYFVKDDRPISQVVSLGADNSQFVIQIEKKDADNKDLPEVPFLSTEVKLNDGCQKVVLTSPAFLDESTVETSCFHIATTIPFRHMVTTTEVRKYHRLSGEIKHSEKIELFQTGSVFYFKSENDATTFAKNLKDRADYYLIGYNHCQIAD